MTFLIRVRGDAGTVQIGDDYANLAFMTKGVATSSNTSRYTEYVVTVTGRAPMMFLRPTGGTACIAGVNNSGSTWTFTIGLGTGTAQCPFYIFDSIPGASAEPYTIRLRNAQGQVTWDAGYKYLRVLGSTPLPEGFFSTDVQGPAGFQWAVAFSDPGWYFLQVNQPTGGAPTYIYHYGMTVIDGACRCLYMQTSPTVPIPPGSIQVVRTQTPSSLIFVDVSNL
jgi:hypothetical protein